MNKKLLFLFFLLALLPLMLASAQKARAQNDEHSLQDFFRHSNDTIETYDKRLQLAGPSDIKYYFLKDNEVLTFKYKHDVNAFIDSSESSGPFELDKIDFSKNSLALFDYHGGDCHARFQFRYSQDDEAKIFTVKVYDYYGGCRAGGRNFTTWAIIPKLPEDYKVEVRRIMVDLKY